MRHTDENENAASIRRDCDWSSAAPSLAVIDALAELEDVEPTELRSTLGVTLYDRIDPEALDALVTDERRVTVSFVVGGYRVLIDGTELIVDRDADGSDAPS